MTTKWQYRDANLRAVVRPKFAHLCPLVHHPVTPCLLPLAKHMKKTSLVLFVLLGLSAWGQSEKSRIVGTVVDITGAVIQGARISAKDSRTGQQSQATSDEKGLYVLNNLTPSSYDLTADSAGLSTAQYTEVRVTVGQERTLTVSSTSSVRRTQRLRA